jgi:hypothetical protein
MVFAFCRTAPSVLFIALATLATGVRALECALRSRISSFDHGLMMRATFFANPVLPAPRRCIIMQRKTSNYKRWRTCAPPAFSEVNLTPDDSKHASARPSLAGCSKSPRFTERPRTNPNQNRLESESKRVRFSFFNSLLVKDGGCSAAGAACQVSRYPSHTCDCFRPLPL